MVHYIFKKHFHWTVEGSFDPEIKKAIVIVAPHTSWYDFLVGLYARKEVKTKIHWLGKKELFIWPFSIYFKATGGTPLDRTSGQNKVEAIARLFESKSEFRLAMAPEGTRKKVIAWKTGFYYIALAAKVPIIPVAFDYGTKTVKVGKAFIPSKDIEKDLSVIQGFYHGVVAKKPQAF
ncbi:MAG: 1-acyl-sn-glycerol-3-phosphate acyltransferase [Flavobacteriaceae bacterium]